MNETTTSTASALRWFWGWNPHTKKIEDAREFLNSLTKVREILIEAMGYHSLRSEVEFRLCSWGWFKKYELAPSLREFYKYINWEMDKILPK